MERPTNFECLKEMSTLYWGIISLIIFFILTYLSKKVKIKKTPVLGLISAFLIVFGTCSVIGFYAYRFKIVGFFLVLGFSLVIIGLGFYDCSRIFLCKTKIEARCRGFSIRSHNGSKEISPIFSFKYEGKRYEVSTLESYSERRLTELFTKGQVYHIYIYAKNPERILIKKSSATLGVFMIIFGVLMSVSLIAIMIKIYIL